MKDEALKLALEALETLMIERGSIYDKAITAIKEALAQSEQEPVAWRYRMPVQDGHWVWNYATYIDDPKDQRCEPLYTTPPQRTWVGLTDEEIKQMGLSNYIKVVRETESKLKSKNNADN